MDSANKSSQTTYTVSQDSDSEAKAKVLCFKSTQTVTHIDVDEKSLEKVVALLEFTPFCEIKENCVKVIDLPKRILKFGADVSTAKGAAAKSVLKKSSDNTGGKGKTSDARKKIDDEAQTQLFVYPHVLEEDRVPTVSNDNSTQTSSDREYGLKISFCNNILLQNIPGNEDDERERLHGAQSYASTVKFSSVADMKRGEIEVKIKNTVDETLKNLEVRLERMMLEYGQAEEDLRQAEDDININDTNAAGWKGDGRANKRKEVLCECQSCGAGGGAVPVLHDPVVTQRGNRSNYGSMPDLTERNIRLKRSKRHNPYCWCKSDTTVNCAGFKAEKVMKPNTSTAQSCCLLVDLDGDYADSYLELLEPERTGTQTELIDVVSDNESSDEEVSGPKRGECNCGPSIEMPWDLITYNPKAKKKKTTCPEIPAAEEVEPTPSNLKLNELTVKAINETELLELTEEALVDPLGEEDVTISEVERRILKLTKEQEEAQPSVPSIHSDDSMVIKGPRIPPKPPKPRLVYEPSDERHNEPYMDRMYQYFPDNCDAVDRCPSHIEMPWENIVLPKNCCIRKTYKPEINKPANYKKPLSDSKTKYPKDLKQKKSNELNVNKPTNSRFEFRLSISAVSSQFIPIQKPTKDVIKIETNASNKSPLLQASYSQPQMGSTRNEVQAKKSDLMRVLNFSDSKSTKPKINQEQVEKKPSNGSSGMSQSQRIALLLESCKKEMEPIKEGINKLRIRIRELNLRDISSFQETQSDLSYGAPSFTGYYPPPPCCYPYYPYIPPYYGTAQQPKKYRTRQKSPKPKRTQSSSLTSSGADQSDVDSGDNYCCNQTEPTKQKKPQVSKIPKPIKKPSDLGKASRSTNTCEECEADVIQDNSCVTTTDSGIQDKTIACGEQEESSENCNSCGGPIKLSEDWIECGNENNLETNNSKKVVVLSKLRVDLRANLGANKYRKEMVEKSSITAEDLPETSENPACKKEGECD